MSMPRRIPTVLLGCAVAALVVTGVVAVTRAPTEPTRESLPTGLQARDAGLSNSGRYAYEDPLAWAMVADHIVVVTALDGRSLPKDSWGHRQIIYRIDEVLWSRARNVRDLPSTLVLGDYRWLKGLGDIAWAPEDPFWRFSSQEGTTYVMALVRTDKVAPDDVRPPIWIPPEANCVLRLTDKGKVNLDDAEPSHWVRTLGDSVTPADIVAAVEAEQPIARRVLRARTGSSSPHDGDLRTRVWGRYTAERLSRR